MVRDIIELCHASCGSPDFARKKSESDEEKKRSERAHHAWKEAVRLIYKGVGINTGPASEFERGDEEISVEIVFAEVTGAWTNAHETKIQDTISYLLTEVVSRIVNFKMAEGFPQELVDYCEPIKTICMPAPLPDMDLRASVLPTNGFRKDSSDLLIRALQNHGHSHTTKTLK